MNGFKDRLSDFLKEEIIFSVSFILALASCFFVKPSMDYIDYINWETILLLFAIMLVVEILKNLAVFEMLVRRLLAKVNDSRTLVCFLTFTCFFSSIFITNDVSLIVFVPFTILTLRRVGRTDLLIFTVSLETIAANVGCMVLPIGAPHNIVLYTASNIPFDSFFLILLPYIAVSLIMLLALTFIVSPEEINIGTMEKIEPDMKNFLKKVFSGIDYYLLLTFIALFILIGNLECIPFFNTFFKSHIMGNEVFWGVAASQFISNVPAAILLSSFSSNYEAIIIGVNIGGLGTLVASMANLISYRIIQKEFDGIKIRYLVEFTLLNLLFMAVMLGVYFLT